MMTRKSELEESGVWQNSGKKKKEKKDRSLASSACHSVRTFESLGSTSTCVRVHHVLDTARDLDCHIVLGPAKQVPHQTHRVSTSVLGFCDRFRVYAGGDRLRGCAPSW